MPLAERQPCGAQLLKNIPVYRWLCFAAMLVPAWCAAVLAVKALLWVLEDKYFLTSNVVFHIIAVRVRARCSGSVVVPKHAVRAVPSQGFLHRMLYHASLTLCPREWCNAAKACLMQKAAEAGACEQAM